MSLIRLVISYDTMKKFVGPNSSYKTGSIRGGCSFLINMPKILYTCNVRLFLNINIDIPPFLCNDKFLSF
jgi:hypothetical protein